MDHDIFEHLRTSHIIRWGEGSVDFFWGGGGIATYISVVKVFSSESISHPILYHISQTMTSSMVISWRHYLSWRKGRKRQDT